MPNPAFKRTFSMAERNMKELAAKLDKMDCTKLWLQKMKNVFKMLDLNDTGYYTIDSVRNFVDAIVKHSEMSSEQVNEYKALISSFAQDTQRKATDKVSFLDFAKLRYVLISDPELLQDYRFYLDGGASLNFKLLDTDRDGYISPKEWKVLYECLGIFDEELQKRSFEILDVNKDGLISLEEYLEASYGYMINMQPTKYDLMAGPLPDVSEYEKYVNFI